MHFSNLSPGDQEQLDLLSQEVEQAKQAYLEKVKRLAELEASLRKTYEIPLSYLILRTSEKQVEDSPNVSTKDPEPLAPPLLVKGKSKRR
jgi:hypothetical protein